MEARRPQSDTPTHEAVQRRHADLVWEHRLLWALLLAILGLWGYYHIIGRVDRQLRGEIIKKLKGQFPQHVIQLDRAHLEQGKSITLEGLEISIPTQEGNRSVIRAQRILASGPIELLSLIKGKVDIEQVRVDGLEVSLWPIDDDHWSVQTLTKSQNGTTRIPPVDVRSGFVRVGGSSIHHEELICHDLRALVQSTGGLDTASIRLPNEVVQQNILIKASLASSNFRKIVTEVQLSADRQNWKLQGSVDELMISDRFLELLPTPLKKWTMPASGLTCRSQAKFGVCYSNGIWNYDVQGKFQDGRLEHPQLPYRLEEFEGDVFCRNGLLQIRNAKASAGNAKFSVNADAKYEKSLSQALIKASVIDLALDETLYRALPEGIRTTWSKLSVSGNIDAEVELAYDGQRWIPDAVVRTKNAALQADVFPYPVRNIAGSFHYRDGILNAPEITGTGNGQAIRGSLKLERAFPRWFIDLEIESDPVPIEKALISALTPRGSEQTGIEKFVESLQPSGMVQVKHARFVRSKINPDVLAKTLEIQVYKSSILYSQFRYPIMDVQGHVTVDNDVILLRDFHGRHDSARIHCQGRCITGDGRLDDLELEFDAQSVPLQEGLHRALPPSVQELWNQAQPSGVLDKVNVLVTRRNFNEPLDVRVLIDEAGLVDTQTGKTVSLRPATLPYLLNDISCHLEYRTGVLNVDIKGYHDASMVEAEGTCRLREDGSWGCLLSWLPQTRIIVDQSLLTSLPESLRQPMLTLDYRGPVNVGGWTMFVVDPSSAQPIAQSWDLELDLEEGRLAGGNAVSGIRGTVYLEGANTSKGPIAIGELDLDAMAIKEVPVLRTQGKFAIQDGKLLLGREASQVQLPSVPLAVSNTLNSDGVSLASALIPNRPMPLRRPNRRLIPPPSQLLPKVQSPFEVLPVHPDDIQAQTLSGQLHAFGTGQLNTGRVSLQLNLVNADFRNLLLDLGSSAGEINGRLYVNAQLTGSLQNMKTLSGSGVIRLREANLFELPFMVRLLRLMQIRAPSGEGVFESADIRFGIDGDRFPLEEVALDGDIISMRGQGWANLRKEIHMDLYTYVGPRGQIAAMLSPLIGNRGATLMRVEVDGTTDNPQVTRTFPGFDKATLERVFPGRVWEEPKQTASRQGP